MIFIKQFIRNNIMITLKIFNLFLKADFFIKKKILQKHKHVMLLKIIIMLNMKPKKLKELITLIIVHNQ